MKTNNNPYYNTHQKLILLNTVTESDIYNNYSYTSCVNWEIEKTSETPLKKLEFNIDKPETGLKKIGFNITTNNNEIDDMNDDKMNCHNDNPINVMYSNINHKNVQQERTTHNSLYRLANSKLQFNYDIKEVYRILFGVVFCLQLYYCKQQLVHLCDCLCSSNHWFHTCLLDHSSIVVCDWQGGKDYYG